MSTITLHKFLSSGTAPKEQLLFKVLHRHCPDLKNEIDFDAIIFLSFESLILAGDIKLG